MLLSSRSYGSRVSTAYHSKYYAHELSRAGGSGVDRLGRALFDACVDLNPHQIEAALFPLRSPLSKGALLADEVGLGKTIEAGLVLCQYWAEKRRHMLVISPASLRKQWAQELEEKFNIPSLVLEGRAFRQLRSSDHTNPFNTRRKVVITSMHFVANHAELVKEIPWNLVVIDEAHKLRNCHRKSNTIGRRIRWATKGRQKLLLTATPLQNSLLELYGLSTLIDERLFGDKAAFRSQYCNKDGDLKTLRKRLQAFCQRNLRKEVTEFVQYTRRRPITLPFRPTDKEHRLYEALSDYLKREDTYAFPTAQKHLLVMLVRKLLASSPYAVVGTLEKIRERLTELRRKKELHQQVASKPLTQEEFDDDLLEQILTDHEDDLQEASTLEVDEVVDSDLEDVDLEKLDAELDELDDYIRWAHGIGIDAKTRALRKALEIGFENLREMGAAEKVVIFTESRRTQEWLRDFLEGNGYAGDVLTFNGVNDDPSSRAVYQEWLAEHRDTGEPTGSRAVDMRTALIDRFKNDAKILIATEAGAEGLNLQFCSALINFDLPWNPQRIEQRIGRCHRYGQKHDVVVINFLNERNAADQRVHELLEEKFSLFSGVFGASDEVLGALESGVDFERRVIDIYQGCRSPEEIEAAFESLQVELEDQIQSRLQSTRSLLLEHFDEEVHDRIKVNLDGTREKLDRIGRAFWRLTKHVLAERASFDDRELTFDLLEPLPEVSQKGRYHLISKEHANTPGAFLYRLSHPLGEKVVEEGRSLEVGPAEVVFDISNHPTKISLVEERKGTAGWLRLDLLRVESYDAEEYLLFSAVDDDGDNVDQETCERFFQCSTTEEPVPVDVPHVIRDRLAGDAERHIKATVEKNLEENNRYFQEAREQLDKWARDMELAAEKKLDDVKRQIREQRRLSRKATTMEDQHEHQKEEQRLQKKKRRLRREIFDVEDEIAERREDLIDALERRMNQNVENTHLFTIRWRVI